jgi:hypothetical protein
MNPKSTILATLFMLATVPAFAQERPVPDAITFTNKTGEVIMNAHVIAHNASEIFYELPGGGARVKLADLPRDIQKDFHYDPVAAIEADRAAAAKKAAADAKIAADKQSSYNKLISSRETSAEKKISVTLSGQVFQVCETGALIEYDHYLERVGDFTFDRYRGLGFVEDCDLSKLTDQAPFPATVLYPIGIYRCKTADGRQRSVPRYTVNLDRAVGWHRLNPGQ